MPRSLSELKRHLALPLSGYSAVIYFNELDDMPFLLSEKGGISANGQFSLPADWQMTRERLERVVIISMEKGVADDSGLGRSEARRRSPIRDMLANLGLSGPGPGG